MNETSKDEQDLAKALDSVTVATNNLSSLASTPNSPNNTPSAQNSSLATPSVLPPTVPVESPITPVSLDNQTPPAHEFPKITPIHDSSDIYYKPQMNKIPPPVTSVAPKQEVVIPNAPETKAVKAVETDTTPQNIEVKTDSAPDTTGTEAATTTDEKVNDENNSEKASSDDNDSPLNEIKKDALSELRPLVDKLNVSPEEKFDTLLLMIRSTDDSSLIEPAHEAAKLIQDESKRAEALLEIIKEIDYLSHQPKGV